MEIKLKIHLPWIIYLDNTVGANYNYKAKQPDIKPACGKRVKLYSQDIKLVTCETCLRRFERYHG